MANANLALRLSPTTIPDEPTPPSSPERFMTPNGTISLSLLIDSNGEPLDDSDDLLFRPGIGTVKSASHVSQKSVFNYSHEEQIIDHHQRTPQQGHNHNHPAMKRMKSLGNLPLFQRDFGGTPQDIVRMRKDFEKHRFGMARMRSMTDLMEIPRSAENYDPPPARVSDEFRFPRTVARDSIFKRNAAALTSKQRNTHIGVGDTKFIGGEFEGNSMNGRKLTKNKSMGMIPDVISERARYDFFYAPKGGGDYHSAEALSDEDEGLGDVTSYEHFNVILRNQRGYQVSEPGCRSPEEFLFTKTPFERGFRRSYMKTSPESPQMLIRQSDGWFAQSSAGGQGLPSWAKLYRYQESVEERLMTVDRNNNDNQKQSSFIKEVRASRQQQQQQQLQCEQRRTSGGGGGKSIMTKKKENVKKSNSSFEFCVKRTANATAASCCSFASSRGVVVLNRSISNRLRDVFPPSPQRCDAVRWRGTICHGLL